MEHPFYRRFTLSSPARDGGRSPSCFNSFLLVKVHQRQIIFHRVGSRRRRRERWMKARQVAVAEQMLSIPLKDGCTINWIASDCETGKLGFPKIHWISFRLKLHFNINPNVEEQPIAHCFIVHCRCVQSNGAESQLQPLGFVVLTQWWTVGVALATKLGRRTQYR